MKTAIVSILGLAALIFLPACTVVDSREPGAVHTYDHDSRGQPGHLWHGGDQDHSQILNSHLVGNMNV